MRRDSNIKRFLTVLKQQSVLTALEKSWSFAADKWFDIVNGVDTYGRVQLDELTIRSENRAEGNAYGPSKTPALKRALDYLNGVVPEKSVLVDFGCGKGKVLLATSKWGKRFAAARGVEFAEELAAAARANIAAYQAGGKRPALPMEVCDCDATQYPIQPDENVFFFYAPFGARIIEEVVANIDASLKDHPRDIWIVHHSGGDVSNTFCNRFGLVNKICYAGYTAGVYSNTQRGRIRDNVCE